MFTFGRWCYYVFTVTVCWCYVIPREWWFRMHFIHAEKLLAFDQIQLYAYCGMLWRRFEASFKLRPVITYRGLYTHTHTHTHTYIYIYIYIHIYIYICMYAHIQFIFVILYSACSWMCLSKLGGFMAAKKLAGWFYTDLSTTNFFVILVNFISFGFTAYQSL